MGKNTRQPDIKAIADIANFFNVSVDYLLGRCEESFKAENKPKWNLIADGLPPAGVPLIVAVQSHGWKTKK